MESILQEFYGIEVLSIKQLDGYISKNFKVKTADNTYVLKVYSFDKRIEEEVLGEIELTQALTHIPEQAISRTIPNLNGDLISHTSSEFYRLQTYVEGTFLAEAEHSEDLFIRFGRFLGNLDKDLSAFTNAAIESRNLEWNLANFHSITPLARHIQDPTRKKLIKHFIIQWNQRVWPDWHSLRKAIIHNDANDWNVLINDDQFGIIDLGDSSYTALISELAIAGTYCIMGKDDPIKWLAYLVKGYNQTIPLEEKEIDLLFYLVAARLVTSLCKSAEQAIAQPNNKYIQISEAGAWSLLEKWIQINPIHCKNELRKACGFQIELPPSNEMVIQHRHSLINRGVSISYNHPIQMDSAIFQYMFDKQGNRFLDAYNNIPHVGHQHPKVVEAAQKQIAKLNTNTRYLYDSLTEYAEQLLSKFPSPLNKVYFVNSGSAASDLAIRLAQNFTSKKKAIVVKHGYHGNTRMGIEISQYKYAGKGGSGKAAGVIEAEMPDTFRGTHTGENAGELYANDLIDEIKGEDQIATFIAEPIVGCGGQVFLAEGYLKTLYPKLKAKGILCISDEVQTGFGRMGTHFWGFEMHGVTPDIVVLGKPIANGHPMGAVVCRSDIAEAFDNGMEFFSSFGGNPVSCEIGKAVLDIIADEELQKNALEVGNYKKQLFNQLKDAFDSIGDVRGSGLFLGIEFINDSELTPHTALANLIKNELRNNNILVSTDGPYNSVIKSKPPMCFSKANADELVEKMSLILKRS